MRTPPLRLLAGIVFGLAPLPAMAAPDAKASAAALTALSSWPDTHPGQPPADAPFMSTPLTKDDAGRAADVLWAAYVKAAQAGAERDLKAGTVSAGGKTMRFKTLVFGPEKPPAKGRSLFISMHGGGNAPPALNDSQWENQVRLGNAYKPAEGVYLAPRAPTNTWNLWHEAHIDPCFDKIIRDFVVLGQVNPDRVYLMGYSAGGDGVYQLAPRMSDRWAAAAMMAGHPNETSKLGFRNIPTAFQVGELDGAYDRNKICARWGVALDALHAADPRGYTHLVDLPKGKPHWMGLEDRKAVPWMEKYSRDTRPDKVVWVQDDVLHADSYWLAADPAGTTAGRTITATRAGRDFAVSAPDSGVVYVRLDDRMTDLDLGVTISRDGGKPAETGVTRTIGMLSKTLAARGDRELMFPAEIVSEPEKK